MKGVIIIIAFSFFLMGLNGCYTVPHYFANDYVSEEIIVYYPDPIPPVDGPWPHPDPPYTPITNPPAPRPDQDQPRDRQPEKPKYSYNSRDPLQGGSGRGSGEINTVPPVRMPDRNDGGSR
jgi:hypothetical protein